MKMGKKPKVEIEKDEYIKLICSYLGGINEDLKSYNFRVNSTWKDEKAYFEKKLQELKK